MKQSVRNALLGVGVLLVAVLLFVILRPGDTEEPASVGDPTTLAQDQRGPTGGSEGKPERPTPPPIPKIVIRNGQPVGGPFEVDSTVGDRIVFKVKSDVEEEVHVHGFDFTEDVGPGRPSFDFDGDITGIYETELEFSGVPIAAIQINP